MIGEIKGYSSSKGFGGALRPDVEALERLMVRLNRIWSLTTLKSRIGCQPAPPSREGAGGNGRRLQNYFEIS